MFYIWNNAILRIKKKKTYYSISHYFSDERDLDFLARTLRQKTSSLSVFNRREWDQLFWAPIIENGGFRPKTSNLVIFGVTDFMYMRQLICQVHIFIISVCFESLDAILYASKIIWTYKKLNTVQASTAQYVI